MRLGEIVAHVFFPIAFRGGAAESCGAIYGDLLHIFVTLRLRPVVALAESWGMLHAARQLEGLGADGGFRFCVGVGRAKWRGRGGRRKVRRCKLLGYGQPMSQMRGG